MAHCFAPMLVLIIILRCCFVKMTAQIHTTHLIRSTVNRERTRRCSSCPLSSLIAGSFRRHQMMSAAKCNNSVRLAIAMLLVIYLSPMATKTHWSVVLKDPPAGQNAQLFTSASMDCVVSVFNIDRRTNLKSSDGSFNNALIRYQLAVNSSGKSSPFSTEYNPSFTHRADRTAIPIRAPPIHYKRTS